MTQSQNFVPIFPKAVKQPTLANAAESEVPPCVPPHTIDSEILCTSISICQPQNKTQNEVAYSV